MSFLHEPSLSAKIQHECKLLEFGSDENAVTDLSLSLFVLEPWYWVQTRIALPFMMAYNETRENMKISSLLKYVNGSNPFRSQNVYHFVMSQSWGPFFSCKANLKGCTNVRCANISTDAVFPHLLPIKLIYAFQSEVLAVGNWSENKWHFGRSSEKQNHIALTHLLSLGTGT